MRWKNFFIICFFIFIYTTLPLMIGVYGKILKRSYPECVYKLGNWSTYVDCGTNDALAYRLNRLIWTGDWAILTIPTGLLAIILLVVVQIIWKFVQKRRNRLNNRSSR